MNFIQFETNRGTVCKMSIKVVCEPWVQSSVKRKIDAVGKETIALIINEIPTITWIFGVKSYSGRNDVMSINLDARKLIKIWWAVRLQGKIVAGDGAKEAN